jgi:exopolysaccharide biosynthesis polyprenyl glycosylphosphotransferase
MGIVAACVPPRDDHDSEPNLAGVPVLGRLADASRVVRMVGADTVAVLACPEMDGTALRELAWQLEKTGTDLCVAPALLDVAGPRTTIRPVAGLPLIHVDHPELNGAKRLVKDVFDRILATLALLLLAPVYVVISILVKTTSPGPVLFQQTRVGKDGEEFRMLKFRTMVRDAERHKESLAERNESDGLLFKMKSDPRITHVGSLLRRYSLDEFPQLINVMLGEMSLVGPRPPLPEEAARYGQVVRRRLVVKPGMTGLWQISGRSDLAWDESVRLDLRYVENWSLALDLLILWKTVAAVIRGSGAY